MQIKEILDTIGYDRVIKGSRAFKDPMVGWDSCFLALAYGEAGELLIAFDNSNHYDMTIFTAGRLDLSVEAVETIVCAFDNKYRWLQQIVTRWLLENDPVNQNRVPECQQNSGDSITPTDTSSASTSSWTDELVTPSGTTTQEVPSPKSPVAPALGSTTVRDVEWRGIPMEISSSSLPIVPST